jgi:hypothetical protein
MVRPRLVFSHPVTGDVRVQHVAVAIGPVGGDAPSHVGILHGRSSGQIEFLHLAWHNRLKNEAPKDDFAWVVSGLPRERAMQVAAQCRRVVQRNRSGEVPYALRFRHSRFRRTGELLLGCTESGLTCATFVLAVFGSVGIDLLELEQWHARPDDLMFQASVVAGLRRTLEECQKKLSSDRFIAEHAELADRVERLEQHIIQVQDEVGCVRYRPAEVAGSSALHDLPASFDDAVDAADRITAEFEGYAKHAGPRDVDGSTDVAIETT